MTSQPDPSIRILAADDAAARRKFWRTLAGVIVVQTIALGLLWLLQMVYGL